METQNNRPGKPKKVCVCVECRNGRQSCLDRRLEKNKKMRTGTGRETEPGWLADAPAVSMHRLLRLGRKMPQAKEEEEGRTVLNIAMKSPGNGPLSDLGCVRRSVGWQWVGWVAIGC